MGRRLTGVLAAVAICAGLAGCGGNGPGASSSPTTTGTCAQVTPTKKCPSGEQVTARSFLTNTVWHRSIGIHASDYQIIVTTDGPSWVRASLGTKAFFAEELPAGQSRTFSARNGKISVTLGSVQVKVSVHVPGRIAPILRYSPTNAPTSLNFHSVS
jgi:hypothetical protein